ncbi:DUF2378 family protein [bacterium]|nr:DUF2378 family protein [bacterium]
MEPEPTPTIRGLFVMSHINALEAERGRDGVVELMTRYGKPTRFGMFENVPVREEVAIIEHVLDILDPSVPPERRAFSAGKLHFENFSKTELGGLILPLFRSNIRLFFMNANHIAGYVFNGVRFISEERGKGNIRIIMENNDYPLDHFAGFFQGVMDYGRLDGEVHAEDLGGKRYAYDLSWKTD